MESVPEIITQRLIKAVSNQFQLSLDGIHGKTHWARVLDNGLHIAGNNDANTRVVSLFALFHDSQRINDSKDNDHGKRGAMLASKMRNDYFVLDETEFDLLYAACELHTNGLTESDVTIQTCWDADRLDLGRVNIQLDPHYLCTAQAKDPQTIDWANERAKNRFYSRSLD